MLESGTDPESYITEYTLVYKDYTNYSQVDELGSWYTFVNFEAEKNLRAPLLLVR